MTNPEGPRAPGGSGACDARGTGRGGARPGIPGPGVAFAAIAGVIVAVIGGSLAGWGIVDTGCSGECATAAIWGGLVGAAVAAVGAAILAVAVLRARAGWRVPRAEAPRDRQTRNSQPSDSLRNDSA